MRVFAFGLNGAYELLLLKTTTVVGTAELKRIFGKMMVNASRNCSSFNDNWRRNHGLPGPVLTSTDRAWYNPNLETRWNMIPGLIGTLAMIHTLMLTAMSVAREREQGTFDQLLVTPCRPF